MKNFVKIIFALLLSGCANDPYRRVYETINNRENGFKSPAERSLSFTPNYGTYKRERELLRHSQSTNKTNYLKDYRKFDDNQDVNTLQYDKTQDLPEHSCVGPCLDTPIPTRPYSLDSR